MFMNSRFEDCEKKNLERREKVVEPQRNPWLIQGGIYTYALARSPTDFMLHASYTYARKQIL